MAHIVVGHTELANSCSLVVVTCEWSDAIVLRADESSKCKLLLTLVVCTLQLELDLSSVLLKD